MLDTLILTFKLSLDAPKSLCAIGLLVLQDSWLALAQSGHWHSPAAGTVRSLAQSGRWHSPVAGAGSLVSVNLISPLGVSPQ